MEETVLIKELSKFGTVDAIKLGKSFTLLMSGPNCSKYKTFQAILEIVTQKVGVAYPTIEVMHNTDTMLLIVLS